MDKNNPYADIVAKSLASKGAPAPAIVAPTSVDLGGGVSVPQVPHIQPTDVNIGSFDPKNPYADIVRSSKANKTNTSIDTTNKDTVSKANDTLHPGFVKSAEDFVKQIPTAVGEEISHPGAAVSGIAEGALNLGPTIVNGVSTLLSGKQVFDPKYFAGNTLADVINKTGSAKDVQDAFSSATTNVGGYELGGAAVGAAGEAIPGIAGKVLSSKLGSTVLGNVVGGQITNQSTNPADRAKQAVFDALFGVAQEGVGAAINKISGKGGVSATMPTPDSASVGEAPPQAGNSPTMVPHDNPFIAGAPNEVPHENPFIKQQQASPKMKVVAKDNLGIDPTTGEKRLATTHYDTKTGNSIIYYDKSLDHPSNADAKNYVMSKEYGRVLDKQGAGGSNISSELPNYAQNQPNLDKVFGDFATKQGQSVEKTVGDIHREILDITGKKDNMGENFALAVAEYKRNPEIVKELAPTFTKWLETTPVSSITDASPMASQFHESSVTPSDLRAEGIPVKDTSGFDAHGFRPVAKDEILPAGYKTKMNVTTGEQMTNAPYKEGMAPKETNIRDSSISDSQSKPISEDGLPKQTKAAMAKSESGKGKGIFAETGLKTGERVEGRASFNPKSINAPEDVQKLFETMDAQNKNFEKGRMSKSNADIEDLARLVNVTPEQLFKVKAGSIANAETVTAARQLVLNKASELTNFLKTIDVAKASDAQLAELKDKFGELVAMQKAVAGFRTEASNVFRSLGIELQPGENATLRDLAQVLQKANVASGEDAALFAGKVARDMEQIGTGRKALNSFLRVWYSAILSGPDTLAKTLLSHGSNILTELAAKGVNPRTWNEFGTSVKALSGALFGKAGKDLVKEISDAFHLKDTPNLDGLFDNKDPNAAIQRAINPRNADYFEGNKFGRVADVVGKIFNAKDRWFSEGIKAMEKASLEVKSDAVTDEISNALSKTYAQRISFRSDEAHGANMRAITKGIRSIQSDAPLSRFIIPFAKIVSNVIDSKLDYLPIFSELRLRDSEITYQANQIIKKFDLGEDENTLNAVKQRLFDQQMGRAILGSVVSVALIGAAMKGKVSGTGPTNYNKLQELKASGWRPDSIRIGDKWIPYDALGPLAGVLSFAGNMYDKNHYDTQTKDTPSAMMANGMVGFMQSQLNQSFLRGISDLINAVNGNTNPSTYFKNLGSSVIPIPSIYTQVKNKIDPNQYQTQTIVDSIREKLGLTGATFGMAPLAKKLDEFGNPTTKDFIPMVTGSTQSNDPVYKYLNDNNLTVSTPNINTSYSIPGSATKEKRKMTPEEYTQYTTQSGKAIYKVLNSVQGQISKLPQEEQQKVVDKIVKSYRDAIRMEIMAKSLLSSRK